jgi:hypothetical protein
MSYYQDREAVYQFQGSALVVRGTVVDVVDGIAGSLNAPFVQSSRNSQLNLRISFFDVLRSVCRSLVLDRKDRFLRYAMPTEEFVRDFTCLLRPLLAKESTSSAPKEFHDWFQLAKLLNINGRSLESILRDNVDLKYLDHAPNRDEYFYATFFGRFFDTVVRMSLRLMISRYGRFGMVTESAKKGDIICVLFGCNVPVLLRSSKNGEDFTFIGECFLNDCMDGSALTSDVCLERICRIL